MKYLDVEKILKKAGGRPKHLQRLLLRSGQPYPSSQRVTNWRARKRLPGAWAGAVIWALACKGVDPLKLLSDTQE